MSEPYFRLSNPSPKAGLRRGGYNHAKGGDHSRYITRESATGGSVDAVVTHQLPAHATAGEGYREQRSNITSYLTQRVEDELEKGNGSRTHYRMTASFGEHIGTGTARQMAQIFLAKNFPDGRGIACIHQNTPSTHIHFYIEARAVDKHVRDGNKLDLNDKRYKSLNNSWTQLHEQFISRDDAQQHRIKVAETEQWKQEYIQAKIAGRSPSRPAPERQDRHNGKAAADRTEAREYGKQKRFIGNERPLISRASSLPEQGTRNLIAAGNQATSAAHKAAEQLHTAVSSLGRTNERATEYPTLNGALINEL
jgi:hypothetical protein